MFVKASEIDQIHDPRAKTGNVIDAKTYHIKSESQFILKENKILSLNRVHFILSLWAALSLGSRRGRKAKATK